MIDSLLSQLDNVKPQGKDRWKAKCPCHNEKTPSLMITDTKDKILVHCFGCKAGAADVAQALGMNISDLFYTKLTKEDLDKRKKQYSEAELNTEKLILEIARQDRAKGVRLSKEDLQREREAFERVNANK